MPRKDDRSGGKSSTRDSNNKRKDEMIGESDYSQHLVDQGKFDGLHYDEEQRKFDNAYWESILGGVPYIGPLIKGVEGANQLEDLYKNTGKVPAYPAISGTGGAGLGYTAANVAGMAANRIANGFHDLYQFYSGEPDSFRAMMNGMYG